MFAAVLDACVLIPSVLADTLLRCAEHELYRPVWSVDILEEVRRNAPLSVSEAAIARRLSAMQRFFPEAEVKGYQYLVNSMTCHPKDRHVLAAAVRAGAEFIVTANLRDFPPVSTERHGVDVQHPDDFLCDLFDRSPYVLPRVIVEQAAATGSRGRPALTVADVLDGLRGCRVTRFAHLVSKEV